MFLSAQAQLLCFWAERSYLSLEIDCGVVSLTMQRYCRAADDRNRFQGPLIVTLLSTLCSCRSTAASLYCCPGAHEVAALRAPDSCSVEHVEQTNMLSWSTQSSLFPEHADQLLSGECGVTVEQLHMVSLGTESMQLYNKPAAPCAPAAPKTL